MNDGRAARGARIGGRWAISARGVLLVAAFALVSTLLRSSRYGIDGVRAAVIGWVVGVTALVVITVIADRTFFRNRRTVPVPAWWVVAYGVIAGVVTALVAAPVNGALTTTPTPSLAVAIFIATGLVTLVLTASAAVFTEIDENRRRRSALTRQELDIRAQDAARAALGESMRRAVQGEIDEATRSIREQLERAGEATDAAARADFAAGLANAVDRDLRPLSRRLDRASRQPVPEPGFWTSARSLLAALQVQPVATGVIAGLAGLSFLAPDTAAAETILRSAAIGALTWLGLLLTRALVRRRPHLQRVEVLVGSAMVVGLTALNFAINKVLVDPARSWTQLGGIVVALPIITILVAVTGRTLAEGTPRTRALEFAVDERQLDALAANREFVRVSRELAQYVHGTLQSHLLATAFAIEDASRTGDPAAVDAAIAGARRAFEMDLPERAGDRALPEMLQQQVDVWDGFVDISIDLDDALSGMRTDDAARVTQVVEEAISNARKHGRARAVEVRIVSGEDGACVTVRDDGLGPGHGDAGMGSMLIDDATGGAWSLRSAENGPGAVLRAVIPLGTHPTGS